MVLARWLVVSLSCLAVAHGAFPEAEIRSRFLHARLYLPDPQNGYYRGTRFDRAGIVHSLTFRGHEYFGQWFDKHDPFTHDAITGPVDVFDPEGSALGYREAKVGENFIRIGIGALRRADDSPFRSAYTYKVVNGGNWTTRRGMDWIEFTHQIAEVSGYGYSYRKRISLSPSSPAMILSYSLQNTGSNPIDTVEFNHNFFVIDSQTSGPGMVAMFVFPPHKTSGTDAAVEIRGREIHFIKSLTGQERVYVPLHGYGPSARDYDIRIENRRVRCGVRITSNRPLEKLILWSRPKVIGPEPYIRIHVLPGQVETWETRYEFYTF